MQFWLQFLQHQIQIWIEALLSNNVLSWLSNIRLSDRKGSWVEHKSFTQWPFHSWTSSLIALTSRTGWVSVQKTIQFTSESLVALLIIAKTWWQWWDLATNRSESVWRFQLLSLLLCISSNFWNFFWGLCVFVRSENMSWNLGNRLYSYNHQGQHDHKWFIISHCSCSCF